MSNIVPSQPREYKGQRVITTEQLAESYNTTPPIIRQNYNRHKKQYIEEIDFFLLEGEDLKSFMSTLQIEVKTNVPSLYLWTESGALNHAKSLNTPEAWNVYRALRDHYFQSKDLIAALQAQLAQVQQENLQLRAQTTLLLPEHATGLQVADVLKDIHARLEARQIDDGLDWNKREKAVFALKKAAGYFLGYTIHSYNLNDKPDQFGNVYPREYPPE